MVAFIVGPRTTARGPGRSRGGLFEELAWLHAEGVGDTSELVERRLVLAALPPRHGDPGHAELERERFLRVPRRDPELLNSFPEHLVAHRLYNYYTQRVMSNSSRTQAIDRLAAPRRLLGVYLREAALAAERKRELGRRIREARQEKRWKQKHLAAAVSVEPVTVSRWENGRHEPDIDMLERIAQATEKPVSFFLDDGAVSPAVAAQAEVLAEVLAVREELSDLRDAVRRIEARLPQPADPQASGG